MVDGLCKEMNTRQLLEIANDLATDESTDVQESGEPTLLDQHNDLVRTMNAFNAERKPGEPEFTLPDDFWRMPTEEPTE